MTKKKKSVQLPELPTGAKVKTTLEGKLYRENMLFRDVQHLAKLVHIDGHLELTEKLTAQVQLCEDFITGNRKS